MKACGTTYCELADGHAGSHSIAYVSPDEPNHRVEWTGRIKVYQPIRPTVHQAATEAAVMSA